MSSQPIALVTGASTGIGAAVARTFAQEGYDVALVARDTHRLEEVHGEIGAAGGRSMIFPVDLRERQAVIELPRRVEEEMGTVRVLANIAGVWHGADRAYYGPLLHETEAGEIAEVMEVGIMAPLLLTRGLIPAMVASEGGTVINLSGTFADGGRGWMHYFVSKRALEQLTVGLADETAGRGVTVNCISPADVATEAYKRFFPEDAATALDPQDVAEVALWLTTPSARHINGQIIEVRATPSS